ncbi:unnamed protein product [Brassica rapa]|uniref:Uncharacterized protein n=1 Tax=Brassica campestris TaxID=3711 RepID=A0A8D9M250_BRACM|nr:unnamed protein product [Brassica rapa]
MNFSVLSHVFQIWKTSGTTYLLVVWKSSGILQLKKKTSRFNYIQTTYNSVVHETTEISLWRESERYVVFRSQEWKKKKGKSILGALRASNWLFMVVVVLMTMAIL